jgi:hypothetical protein
MDEIEQIMSDMQGEPIDDYILSAALGTVITIADVFISPREWEKRCISEE